MVNAAHRLVLATMAGETGSVVRRAGEVASRRCAEIAAWMMGLDRKAILRRGRATMVGGDFLDSAAEQTALHP